MVPTCGASRASLMSGLRPTPRRFVTYTARADKETPDVVTLNTFMKDHGYSTTSLGKVFHFPDDNAHGWSRPSWRPKGSDYQDKAAEKAAIAQHREKYPNRKKVRGPAFESFDAPDDSYRDHKTASQAIEYLSQYDDSDSPFFLAVGFFKPHLPFCAPKRFWDMYSFDQIGLPDNDGPPENAPDGAVHLSGELRAYSGIPPAGPVEPLQARRLIHGYYACVSFIDDQVGRLLDALEQHDLDDNTIIVLWGDHGWQLGEHGMWNKHSCFETSMHAPLFISAPSIPAGRTAALTEFIDIYPTICELTGLDPPEHLDGSSLVPLMNDTTRAGKSYAIGRYRAGDTIRSEQFRYSEYRMNNGAGEITGRMLYDHHADPDENRNVVASPGQASTGSLLSDMLNAGKGKSPKKAKVPASP